MLLLPPLHYFLLFFMPLRYYSERAFFAVTCHAGLRAMLGAAALRAHATRRLFHATPLFYAVTPPRVLPFDASTLLPEMLRAREALLRADKAAAFCGAQRSAAAFQIDAARCCFSRAR